MKATEVTIEVLKQYFALISYKLVEFSPAETKKHSGIRPLYHIVDNLGKKTGYVVNEELLEINTQVSLTCFWLDKCWVETIDDDAISISTKEDNSAIFINFHKQERPVKKKKKPVKKKKK